MTTEEAVLRDGPTVFILDTDHETCRQVASVAREMELAWETCRSLADLFATWKPRQLGCLVLDTRVPGLRGPTRLERLRTKGFGLPVILLDRRPDLDAAVEAIKAGAINYLRKPCPSERLATAILEALAWDRVYHDCLVFSCRARRRLGRLTTGEREVLDRLVCGQSNRDAAAELGISIRTVEVRRAKLMKKMRCRSMVDLLRAALAVSGTSGTPIIPFPPALQSSPAVSLPPGRSVESAWTRSTRRPGAGPLPAGRTRRSPPP